MRRAVVTGMGVVAPNGIGLDTFWRATLDGQSGVRSLDRFDAAGCASRIAGQVEGFRASEHCSERVERLTDRSTHFAIAAARMAMRDAGLSAEGSAACPDRTAVYMGTGLAGILFQEDQLTAVLGGRQSRPSPPTVPRTTPNAPASYIAVEFGLRGPNLTICTACSSGAHAIGQALDAVRLNRADVVLCGGTEACLSRLTFQAFDVLRVMSRRNDAPQRASRPFDLDRDGFVMGEGCAMLAVEERGHAMRRGARIYGEVLGYGASCGAFHIVMPVADGSDAAAAMERALEDARLSPAAVDYISAHGTGTRNNDVAETLAIKRVFGGIARRVPISSTKSVIGHTIGAAGAIESVACLLAIRDGIVPPTANLETPDPECDLDYVPGRARPSPVRVAMNNSFGFGNSNAVLLFGRHT